MSFVYDMIYFITVLLFGIAVSFCFAGITVPSRKNLYSFLLFCVLEGLLQLIISALFGMALAKKLYPLMTHLPLILYLIFRHRCPPLNALVSVFSAYLCCQIPWWFSYFLNLFFTGKLAYTIIYLLSAAITLLIIVKYIAVPAAAFIRRSEKNAIQLGSIPFFYYCFDYATTVYTDWLYSGNPAAVQFMPSVIACFYFCFVVTYYRELTLKEEARHQSETMSLQLSYAATTLDHMRSLHESTITYRHDMRHHLGYIQMLAASGKLEKIQSYIHEIQSDLEAITPQNFCQNEVLNLILSTYDLKAKKQGIALEVRADVPAKLPVCDRDLCVILSNALENALHATLKAFEKNIHVRLSVKNSALLLQVSNPFVGTVVFEDNLPVATPPRKNHGIGTRSIAAIVDSRNGQYSFSTEGERFLLRILLPMKGNDV